MLSLEDDVQSSQPATVNQEQTSQADDGKFKWFIRLVGGIRWARLIFPLTYSPI